MASLRKRGRKYLIQFYWRGEQRSKTLGAVNSSNAQSCKAQVEAALDAIRHGQHSTASRLLDQGFDILDIVFPNEKTAHLLKSNGNRQQQQPGNEKLLGGESLSVGELVPRYLSYLKDHESDGHWRRVKSRLSHLVAFAGGISVMSLDGELLEAYVAARKLQDTRDETRKNEIASIRAMLNWSVETGTLESLPVKKFPVIKTDEADPFLFKSDIDLRIAEAASAGEEIDKLANRMVLTPVDIERLVDVARRKNELLVLPIRLVACTGMRRSEMVGLRKVDFDPNLGRISVHSGKGSKKKRRTVRNVDVHKSVLPSLRASSASLPNGSGWLFPVFEPTTKRTSQRPRIDCRADRAGRLMRDLLADTEFELLGGWHALRHSFITVCVWQGLTFEQISQWTGHIERETQERYTHYSGAASRRLMDDLPFGGEDEST